MLGVECSTSRCSVAIGDATFVEELAQDTPREHHALILPMVAELLESCHVALRDLEAIAFGCGPGSFTGLRIAASIAQGLAFGADLQVLPVSSHTALAATAVESITDAAVTRLLVATDAHMGEIYWALYGVDGSAIHTLRADQLASAGAWRPEQLCAPSTTLLVGDAWELHPQLRAAQARYCAGMKPEARQIVRLAAAMPLSARLPPEQAEPVYVRGVSVWKKVAEQAAR